MISYKLPEEKTTLLHYAKLLGDSKSEEIIQQGELKSRDEAIHFAEFFWRMVKESNIEDKKNNENSEYILEKIIISLMAYFRSSGHEDVWEEVSDRH
jgi:hypothetical protein